jgi:hypothetical protein
MPGEKISVIGATNGKVAVEFCCDGPARSALLLYWAHYRQREAEFTYFNCLAYLRLEGGGAADRGTSSATRGDLNIFVARFMLPVGRSAVLILSCGSERVSELIALAMGTGSLDVCFLDREAMV